jgi:hypothetical protein
LGRDGRVFVDTPTFTWSFVDPAGRRAQSAVQLQLALPGGAPLWESGVVPTADGAFAYAGPALPPGAQLELRLRVGSGRAWSDWARAPLRRNCPPRGAHVTTPRPGAERWPVELRAAIPPDPDGDPQRVHFEILGCGGALETTRPLVALDDTVRYRARALAPGEQPGRRARAVVCDGFESVPSAWVHLDGEQAGEPSEPPGRMELPGHTDPGSVPPGLLGAGPAGAASPDLAIPAPLAAGTRLRLAARGPGALTLFDVRGRRLRALQVDADGVCIWDGRDGAGRPLPPGIYFLRQGGRAAGPRHRVVWLGR